MSEKTAKIKVLWVCTWYPNRVHPHLATFVHRQALATARLAEVAILFVTGDAISDYQVEVENDPYLIVRVYFPQTNHPIFKLFRQFRAQWKGYKTLQNHFGKPDIVHVQSLYPAAIFALYLDFFKRIPFVVTEHFSGYMNTAEFQKRKIQKIFTQFVFNHARVVMALSGSFIDALTQIGFKARQFRIVFNVVDTELFTPIFKEKREGTPFQFANFSRFVNENKNITGIIKSAAELAKKRQDFVVNLIGDGDDKDLILQCATSLGVLNRIVFWKGYLQEKETAQAMQNADCVIMFSNLESQSVVTLEAASCGLPLIATETGGIGERVTPETGILLNIGDEAGLVEAMNEMIDNYQKYAPPLIRAKIVEKCSVEAVGKAIVSVYEKVLNT